eukprot:5869150-Pyramimonas_sp.AAC.1
MEQAPLLAHTKRHLAPSQERRPAPKRAIVEHHALRGCKSPQGGANRLPEGVNCLPGGANRLQGVRIACQRV